MHVCWQTLGRERTRLTVPRASVVTINYFITPDLTRFGSTVPGGPFQERVS
jgi:hypothetical protein